MSQAESRLLDPEFVPSSLWDPASETLFIPPSLAKAYGILIDRHSLLVLSESRDPHDPPVGGTSQERTDQHFAQAFDGSAARTELALLDPKQSATLCSNALISSLAGGRLSLTDAPCGAAAAAFALLSTVAELRAQRVLPRMPLDVSLIGAELSEPARKYAASMLEELRAPLEEQAIFLREADFLSWDVTDKLSNTNLIRLATIRSASTTQRLLVVANFNAVLERDRKRMAAQPQLEELFRHASGSCSVAIWMEPNMNRAKAPGGLFQWLKDLVSNHWKRFAKWNSGLLEEEPVFTCSARFSRPLQPSQTVRVGLAVMRIDLVRSDE